MSEPRHCGPAVQQANGKIILGGGELVEPSSRRVALARYLPDGSLDPGFDGGVAFNSFGSSYYADLGGIVLQPDGRIVSIANVGHTDNQQYLGAWRLLGDGPGGAPADPDALGWSPPPPSGETPASQAPDPTTPSEDARHESAPTVQTAHGPAASPATAATTSSAAARTPSSPQQAD